MPKNEDDQQGRALRDAAEEVAGPESDVLSNAASQILVQPAQLNCVGELS